MQPPWAVQRIRFIAVRGWKRRRAAEAIDFWGGDEFELVDGDDGWRLGVIWRSTRACNGYVYCRLRLV